MRSSDVIAPARRAFLGKAGTATLSAAAIALLAGREVLAQGGSASMQDVGILNVALALEHEAINAYQLGAQSGLLTKPVLDVAVLFQSHHKGHRDALVTTIRRSAARRSRRSRSTNTPGRSAPTRSSRRPTCWSSRRGSSSARPMPTSG